MGRWSDHSICSHSMDCNVSDSLGLCWQVSEASTPGSQQRWDEAAAVHCSQRAPSCDLNSSFRAAVSPEDVQMQADTTPSNLVSLRMQLKAPENMQTYTLLQAALQKEQAFGGLEAWQTGL